MLRSAEVSWLFPAVDLCTRATCTCFGTRSAAETKRNRFSFRKVRRRPKVIDLPQNRWADSWQSEQKKSKKSILHPQSAHDRETDFDPLKFSTGKIGKAAVSENPPQKITELRRKKKFVTLSTGTDGQARHKLQNVPIMWTDWRENSARKIKTCGFQGWERPKFGSLVPLKHITRFSRETSSLSRIFFHFA